MKMSANTGGTLSVWTLVIFADIPLIKSTMAEQFYLVDSPEGMSIVAICLSYLT